MLLSKHLLVHHYSAIILDHQFYKRIRQPLDTFYHVAIHEDKFTCVPVKHILKHCIAFEKDSSKSIIITPVSSYEKHD